jgi:large subunit ribosomal protein L18
MNTKVKSNRRLKIKKRIASKVRGTGERPRLVVYRSNKQIYAQLVDDTKGVTLCATSSRETGVVDNSVPKIDQSVLVGKKIAEKALAAGIKSVVFDRNGYLYHGRVKSLADAAREGGLIF